MKVKQIIILPFLLSVSWQLHARKEGMMQKSCLTPPSPKLSQFPEILANVQNREHPSTDLGGK